MISSLEQWRKSPELVAWAGKMLSSAEWRLLNAIMQESEHVRLWESPGTEPLQKLGRIEGWDLYNNRLKLAAIGMDTPKEIEATFEPQENEVVKPKKR